MNEIGEKLKQARKDKGYSLDDLQQITKIQKRYLEAIEEGNLDVMPGKFYARAFIKQYADTVGLDGDQLLSENNNEVPETHEEAYTEQLNTSQTRVRTKKSNDILDKLISLLPTIIVTLIVLAIMVGIWLAFSNNKANKETRMIDTSSGIVVSKAESQATSETESKEESTASSTSERKEEKKDKEKDKEKKQTITNESVSGRDSVYTVQNAPASSSLTLTATNPAWIQVNDEAGASLFAGTMVAGQTEEIKIEGAQTITLILGNAANTKIKLNGEDFVSANPLATQNVQLKLVTAAP
ncbi:helix-turn-helix domain-containing protein [Isobaculum melis]|uniref:helix-turn-helix domain-containing protein n=1 Tax=Isobaculum melis TaxID=142588 RepID=UPI0015A7103D|nr:helix-turn-helix domain-containing protein [Isobaculum melis]